MIATRARARLARARVARALVIADVRTYWHSTPWTNEEERAIENTVEKARARARETRARMRTSAFARESDVAPWKRSGAYDVQAFERWFARAPWRVARRAIVVALELGSIALGVARGVGERRGRARALADALARLGPAYIKLGQVMSTRADVFPVEYVEELAKLQDSLPPAEAKASLGALERELGVSVTFFEAFDATPVAAASLAQVYRATLPGGREVAIKLQRPGLAELVALDAVILRRFVAVIGAMRNFKSDVVGIVDELVGRIFEEMDYTQEADNCERFRRMYAADGDAGTGLAGFIGAPRVIRALSTPSVLTMEWVEGLRLTDLKGMVAQGFTPTEVLDRGLRASLHQLLTTGFMHTDPHPGNLIVAARGELIYLDFGMTVEVPIEIRRAMVRGLIGFVNRDSAGLVGDLKVMNFLPPHVDAEAAGEALRTVFAGESATKVRDSMDFMGVVSQLSTALMQHGFRLPPYFSRILRALAALEGTATTIDPSFRVIERSYPFVLSRVLSDRSPEMRESLRRLLLADDGSIRYKRLIRLVQAYGSETAPMSSDEKETSRVVLEKVVAGARELAFGERDCLNNEQEARRATKIAIEDALKFLLSDKGARTREKLVEDFLDACEKLLADDPSPPASPSSSDDVTLSAALATMKATTTAIIEHTDLLIPVLGKAAQTPEAIDAARSTLIAAAHRVERVRERRVAAGATACADASALFRRIVHEITRPPPR